MIYRRQLLPSYKVHPAFAKGYGRASKSVKFIKYRKIKPRVPFMNLTNSIQYAILLKE